MNLAYLTPAQILDIVSNGSVSERAAALQYTASQINNAVRNGNRQSIDEWAQACGYSRDQLISITETSPVYRGQYGSSAKIDDAYRSHQMKPGDTDEPSDVEKAWDISALRAEELRAEKITARDILAAATSKENHDNIVKFGNDLWQDAQDNQGDWNKTAKKFELTGLAEKGYSSAYESMEIDDISSQINDRLNAGDTWKSEHGFSE